jgi:hypothetical protein
MAYHVMLLGLKDRSLLADGKRTKMVLWSGDTLPTPEALAAARRGNLLNMNGSDTIITHSAPTAPIASASAHQRTGMPPNTGHRATRAKTAAKTSPKLRSEPISTL